MNSNTLDENLNLRDYTSKENDDGDDDRNNSSSTKKPPNSELKDQDELLEFHVQVTNNPVHNLSTQNLNNQTNALSFSITITSSKVLLPNSRRCVILQNLDCENSTRIHPWINIAHFRIKSAKFLSGGFCTLRHVNPNLRNFF